MHLYRFFIGENVPSKREHANISLRKIEGVVFGMV